MAKLSYHICNPNFTVYHRAALGGLASTILAWANDKPLGVDGGVDSESVWLDWTDELSDREAVQRILGHSFRISADRMIDLPGQGIPAQRVDLKLAAHNGIMQTFLQFHKFRDAEAEPRKIAIQSVDDDEAYIFSYKGLNSYFHQTAENTGLLTRKDGKLPDSAKVPQWIIPGAFTGSRPLEARADELFLLLYLVVACAVFHLRPRSGEDKLKSCLVVPDVQDLNAFSRALRRISASSNTLSMFTNSYLGRVVGGAEEAALKFLIDVKAADEINSEHSISGCLAVGMGKVAWDSKQINRSLAIRVKDDYDEINVFRAANQFLGRGRVFKNESGEAYVIPASAIPELIAANLASGRHWCSYFIDLISDKKERKKLLFAKGGLSAMNDAINDSDDRAIISVFHEAWRRRMASIYESSEREHSDPDRQLEVEREKVRNAILRTRTSEALAGWFLRFISDATHGGSLHKLCEESTRVREFIFNSRNFNRFQNLCLFALVSYESKSTANTGGR